MRNTLPAKIIGIAAAAACALLAVQEPAAASNQQSCENGWEQSSASDYCPNATIGWLSKAVVSCTVNATCTVDVNVGGTSQRISQSVSASSTAPEALKVCIRRTADDSDWELVLAGNCGGATDAATAVEEGLPAQ